VIHTIIFDVGGTLVNADCVFTKIVNNIGDSSLKQELIDEFTKIYNFKEFHDVKTIMDVATKKVLQNNGIDKEIKASAIYKNLFVNESYLFPEVKEILDFLKGKEINLLILSDADVDVLLPELENLKIKNYFSEIFISSELKCYKTSRKIVEKILPHIKKPLQGVLLVGETKADVNTAKNLGVKSVYIKRNKKQLEADYVITNLLELKRIRD
jgi:HAD superfamily hydrolase (TIGR01549 family)